MKGSAQLPTSPVVWDTAHIDTVSAGPGHFPWIAWDECTGMLAVAWLDTRNTPPAGRDTYVAAAMTRDANGNFLSADNLNWEKFKVSDAAWTTTTFPASAYDYIGLAAGDGRIFPVWSDDRSMPDNLKPYTSPILLWGVNQDSVTATPVNNGNGTMTVTATWTTNLAASADDRITLTSPHDTDYTSEACSTCADADGKTHTVVFAGIPCEPGIWTYTVESRRSGCSQSRTSDAKTFFVAPNVGLTGSWPPSAGAIAKCPGGDPVSYNYTVGVQFQGSCVSQVAQNRMTLEALTMNPSIRKLAFFPQSVPQPADADATSGSGYATTITEHQVGGCGSDSARIYLDGVAIGKAWVPFVANVDLNGTGAVDAGDLSLFVTSLGTCPGHPSYDSCANFAGDDCVDPSDLSAFAVRGSPLTNPFDQAQGSSDGSDRVWQPAGSMNVAVRLEGLQGRSAFGVVLRPTTNSLQFGRWVPREGYEATTIAVDTADAQGRRLVVLALDLEPDASGNVELGNLIFTTSSPDVALDDLPISFEDVAARGAGLASEPEGVASPSTNARVTRLHQNLPNPFNPRTTIRYSVGTEANVRLAIFDVAGGTSDAC
jgi:hypothetical protein